MKGFNFMYIIIAVIVMVLSITYVFRFTGLRPDMGGIDHVEAPDTVLFSLSEPQVTDEQLLGYLSGRVGSRLRGKEEKFFELGMMNDIDPAFAVAVSEQETLLGKRACKGVTKNCNNFFCIEHDAVKLTDLSRGKCGKTEWAHFETPEDGIEAFFLYMGERFVDKNPTQDTISKIGCEQGSGFDVNCFCTMSGSDCETWVFRVTSLTNLIRDYSA